MTIIPAYADINWLGLAAFGIILALELWHRVKYHMPVQILISTAGALFGAYGVGGYDFLPLLALMCLLAAVYAHLLCEIFYVLPKEKTRLSRPAARTIERRASER